MWEAGLRGSSLVAVWGFLKTGCCTCTMVYSRNEIQTGTEEYMSRYYTGLDDLDKW